MINIQDCVSEIMKHARDAKVPIVVDGVSCKISSASAYSYCTIFPPIYLIMSVDFYSVLMFVSLLQDGLFLVTNCLDLVSDYHLAVLTPNVNEYKRLVQKVLNCEINDDEAAEQLISLSRR